MSDDANQEWTQRAHRAVAALAATGRQFTVDDVHAMMRGGVEHENGKAMGSVMQYLGKRLGVIEAQPVWQASCRNPDRPIRVFVGTNTVAPGIEVTEDDIVSAMLAMEETARERARQMREHLRSRS